jgi:hypothetical protein
VIGGGCEARVRGTVQSGLVSTRHGGGGLVKEGASCLFGGVGSGVVAESEVVERWMVAGARAGAQEKR